MPRRKKSRAGRPRKEVVIKLEAPKPARGRPAKEFSQRHQTTLAISGTIDEINYIREQAKLSGKSLSRYIIESVI